PLLGSLEARLLLHEGKWLAAARLLGKVYAQLAQWPDVQLQADLLLGKCYEQLGDANQQFEAYQRAARVDPFSEPVCLGLASALTALGKLDQALELYRTLAPRSPQARLGAGRLLILRTLQTPPRRRQWAEVEQFLSEAARGAPESPELAVLRAEALA